MKLSDKKQQKLIDKLYDIAMDNRRTWDEQRQAIELLNRLGAWPQQRGYANTYFTDTYTPPTVSDSPKLPHYEQASETAKRFIDELELAAAAADKVGNL